jgi:hypothetical protein
MIPRVEPLGVVVLVACVLVLCVAAVEVAVGLFLWHAVSQLQPIEDLESRLARNNALCEALEAQVTKLRTSKAGRVSNAKRQPPPEPEDEMYEGLTEEERALFQ